MIVAYQTNAQNVFVRSNFYLSDKLSNIHIPVLFFEKTIYKNYSIQMRSGRLKKLRLDVNNPSRGRSGKSMELIFWSVSSI